MVKETIKNRLRYAFALAVVLSIAPLCDRERTISGASSAGLFAGEEIVCAIDLGDDMYGAHGLETGFNYELLKKFAKDNRCSITIRSEARNTSWLDSLETGVVDIVITHENGIGSRQGLISTTKADECSVWVMNEDDDLKLRQVNRWLSYINNSPVSDRMQRKYRTCFNPDKPFEEGTRVRAISPYDDVIKKYAAELGWDWRMLAAVVYQESKFSINSTSVRGAKGLMQVLPSTAEHYGITDLLDPEANIKAGTRHLQRLQNIWKKNGLEGEELVKFTLASYNAGEGRIADCRNIAYIKGYDNNVWDNIVEIIPLMRDDSILMEDSIKFGKFSGRETIAYIESIMLHYQVYCQVCPSI